MISPVLITGSSGQLATQFFERMRGSARVVSTSRRTLDITNADQTRRFVADLAPRLIINCAAYNHVDDAEGKRAAALRINGEAVRNLADATNAQGATLVHFSTDFVFDGEKQTPYTEEDPPQPLSVYGESKLLGERNASHADRHYVLRLSSLYG